MNRKVGQLAWHYTIGERLTYIVRDGIIRPATAHIAPGERPIAWFTLSREWEPTACKAWRNDDGSTTLLTALEMHNRNLLLCRIGVSPLVAPHDWPALRRKGRVPEHDADALSKRAKQLSSDPTLWRGTFLAVPRSQWKAVEFFTGLAWEPLDLELLEKAAA